jgi:hypothetical protein
LDYESVFDYDLLEQLWDGGTRERNWISKIEKLTKIVISKKQKLNSTDSANLEYDLVYLNQKCFPIGKLVDVPEE